jgi:hypothetical protein
MKMKKKSLVSGGTRKGQAISTEEASFWTLQRTTAVAILFLAVFIMGMMTAFFLCASTGGHCSIRSKPTQVEPPRQDACPSVQETCAVCESFSESERSQGEEFHEREVTSHIATAVHVPTTAMIFRGYWSTRPRSNWTSSAFWNPCYSSSSSLPCFYEKGNGQSSYCRRIKTWEILQIVWRLVALVMSMAIGYTSHYDMKSLAPSWRLYYKAMSFSLMSFGVTPVLSILPATATYLARFVSGLFDHVMLAFYHASLWIEHNKITNGVSVLLRFNALVGAIVLSYFSLQHARDWLQILLAFTLFATLAMHGSTLFWE